MIDRRHQNINRLLFLISLIFIPLCFAYSNNEGKGEIEQGVLDLRNGSLPPKMLISLKGDWLFYWDRLVPAGEFSDGTIPPGGKSEYVPSYWSSYKNQEGMYYSGTGYASYFLRILLPAGFSDSLGFTLPVFDSSFDFYINGKEEGSSGIVGTTKDSSDPGYTYMNVYFKPVSDTLNLLVHVSNFDHRRGGFWKNMFLGRASAIRHRSAVKELVVHISLGFLGAFILFFLSFYVIFPRNKTSLYFVLALFGIFMRLTATNIFPFQMIFGSSWIWLIRTEYLGTYLAFAFGLWYLYSIFPDRKIRLFTIINSIISGIFVLIILLFPVEVFSYSMLYLQPVALVSLGFYLVISFRRMKEKPKGNILFFAAMLLFVLALANDIFLSNSWPAISGEYLLHFSALFLIFVQAVSIIYNWVEIYVENEQLIANNKFITANLENLVEERTRELDERNDEIKKKSKKIAAQNDELQNELDFKNRFFSILAHDLRDPLSSINLYLDMAATDLPLLKRKDILESTAGLARSAYNLVENLLYWGRSQGKQLTLNLQMIQIDEVVKDVISLLGETARQKGVNLFLVSSRGEEIESDRQMLMIILRNLVSNAIKFSHRGHDVFVNVEYRDDGVTISVKDNGVGMSEEQIDIILSDGLPESTYGTRNEKGTGLGLKLCLDLVKLLGGKMNIESRPGNGTIIDLWLPMKL